MATEFDLNELPLAYLITIRTFGTWLHGDKRTSIDRHGKNTYGTPRISPNANLEKEMRTNAKEESFLLNAGQRVCVHKAIVGVCKYRRFELLAINIRTNHLHAVVSANSKPEPIIHSFKSYGTRGLREAGLIGEAKSVWARGKSRRYLWKDKHVELAIDYVNYGQGGDLSDFDELVDRLK